jgi:hypothetical protein
MSNSFYVNSGYPGYSANGDSASARSEFAAIEAGFNKFPTLSGSQLRILRINSTGALIEAVFIQAADVVNTPAGNIAATTVQAALNELDTEKATLAQANYATNVVAATVKATPVDADLIGISDSAAAGVIKSLSWANLKATFLATVNSFTKAQRGTPVALTSSAASIAIDLSLANNLTHTTSENTTLAAPTNAVAGQSGVIVITQGAAARTLAYNAFWKFAGGAVPTLTATVGAVDVFMYYVESASRATCSLVKDTK